MCFETLQDGYQVALIIPTHNAARNWTALYDGIRRQQIAPQQVLIIDSSSSDGTERLARDGGFRLVKIDQRDFDHGGTRQLAAQYFPEADILLYLTQDAIPSNADAFCNILAAFKDPWIGAAYGRQLPRPGAGPLEAHARHFNYPAISAIRTPESRKTLGFKAVFASNSFAAYRRTALEQVGGFPSGSIFAEDSIVFARLQLAGWKTAYVADAAVIHSHGYTLREEFSRYFDIGVFHARESWIEREFRTPYGEGRRFVLSEIRYLLPKNAHLIPWAALRTLAKVLGYRSGRKEAHLPLAVKRALSMHKNFWRAGAATRDHEQLEPRTPVHPPGSD
jgi:rhamnosyltransferase